MDGKVAFVFDTNFIVKNNKLDEICKQLDEKYIPYVTQVSIEERKAQQCKEKQAAYEKASDAKNHISSLVTIKDRTALEDELERFRERVQQAYENLFNGTIIKYEISSECFSSILQRAFEKMPPFNDSDNASDKGFKDTLMWLSIKEFFKDNGENEVLFITDDKGFVNKVDILSKEFENHTGKKIQIKNSSYYDTLLKNKTEKEVVTKKDIPNIESIREQLQELLYNICWVTDYDYYGEEMHNKSFTSHILFNDVYVKSVMDDLGRFIQEHLFSQQVQVSSFLDKDSRLADDRKINIIHLEKLNKLYIEIKENYREHTDAFITTITDTLNENYKEAELIDLSGVPF